MTTIAAIATPPGHGGIGIVRLSGPNALSILHRIFHSSSKQITNFQPWKMYHGTVHTYQGELLDEVLTVYMPAPRTYTGEDIVEVHCHGSPVILNTLLETVIAFGARQAEKGEFTRRAFMNGRMDLSQAEAVAELIAAPTRIAQQYSLRRLDGSLGKKIKDVSKLLNNARQIATLGIDFPDDEIDGGNYKELNAAVNKALAGINQLLKNVARATILEKGPVVLLAGPVNAGKSSLLNALAGRDRALVTEIPGTTRDFLEVEINIDGLLTTIIDTAGFRTEESDDPVENMGIAKTQNLFDDADLIVVVVDGSRSKIDDLCEYNKILNRVRLLAGKKPVILAKNKIDLDESSDCVLDQGHDIPVCGISALTGANIDKFISLLREILLKDTPDQDGDLAPNIRQAEALKKSANELILLNEELEKGLPFDCAMARLDCVASYLDSLLGLDTPSEILDQIFSQFCIGK